MLTVLALVATACGGDDDTPPGARPLRRPTASRLQRHQPAASGDDRPAVDTTAPEETETDGSRLPTDEDLDLEATIRITTAAPGVSLDPHRERQSGDRDYTNLLYDRLTIIDTDQSVAPMLAESWEFSEDGTTLTLTLRADATFQDGTPVDAAAVKANLERAQTLADGTVASFLSNVSAIEAVDDTTVALTITEGGADLPAILATNVGMIVNPKAFTDGRDLDPGPRRCRFRSYQVVEFVPNERAVFERVDGHWDPDAGKVKRIEMGFIPRGSSRVDGLRAGQLDLIQVTGVDQQVGLPLVESGEFGGFQLPVSTGHQLMFNVAWVTSAPPSCARRSARRSTSRRSPISSSRATASSRPRCCRRVTGPRRMLRIPTRTIPRRRRRCCATPACRPVHRDLDRGRLERRADRPGRAEPVAGDRCQRHAQPADPGRGRRRLPRR